MDISNLVFVARLLVYSSEDGKINSCYRLVTRYQEPPLEFINLYTFELVVSPEKNQTLDLSKSPNVYVIDKLYPIDKVSSIKTEQFVQAPIGGREISKEDNNIDFEQDLENRVRLIRKFRRLNEKGIIRNLRTAQISKGVIATDKDVPMLRLQEKEWCYALKQDDRIVDLSTSKVYPIVDLNNLRNFKIEEGMEYATKISMYGVLKNQNNSNKITSKKQFIEQIVTADEILNRSHSNEIINMSGYQKRKK